MRLVNLINIENDKSTCSNFIQVDYSRVRSSSVWDIKISFSLPNL